MLVNSPSNSSHLIITYFQFYRPGWQDDWKSPLSVLLGAEQGDHKLLLLGELGKLSIINSLESVLPSDAAKADAEEQKFAVTYVELDEPVEGGG